GLANQGLGPAGERSPPHLGGLFAGKNRGVPGDVERHAGLPQPLFNSFKYGAVHGVVRRKALSGKVLCKAAGRQMAGLGPCKKTASGYSIGLTSGLHGNYLSTICVTKPVVDE